MMIRLEVSDQQKGKALDHAGASIALKASRPMQQLLELAQLYPEQWLGWYTHGVETDFRQLKEQAKTNYTMLSAGRAPAFIYNGVDYLEDTAFINYAPQQWYPTWVMSADTGMIHASVLNAIGNFSTTKSFEFDLNLLSRSLYKQGLFCYGHLQPCQQPLEENDLTYAFTAAMFKKRWLGFLLLSHIYYEKRFPFFAFAKAIVSTTKPITANLLDVQSQFTGNQQLQRKYDVVIPTMGRASYLKEVLKDLKAQSILPHKVIIVEQNADAQSQSELDYLQEDWGFEVVHQFIHQTGACHARNLALDLVSAPWVLLFDDDIRFESHLLSKVFDALEKTAAHVINMACLQEHEEELQRTFKQWPYFGSGCSMLSAEVLQDCRFDMALEHGYGEDVDFGMQIRRSGHDIIYAPQIQIKHLKAPIGGFRKPHRFAWSDEQLQPKPSPQIMYFRKKNFSKKQLQGYKLVQLFKTYGDMGTYNPYKHIKVFRKRWSLSNTYAAAL